MPGTVSKGGFAVQRLPRLLRRAIEDPTSGVVHKLRTTIRRAEIELSHSEDHRKLLNQLKSIRKRSGRVRDVDVQLEILRNMGQRNTEEARILRNFLLSVREKKARKLGKAIREQFGSKAENFLASRTRPAKVGSQIDLTELCAEFKAKYRAQQLDESNLHSFRIECKHLRYRAELATHSELRDRLLCELKRVQDAIGTWHDHLTLLDTSREVLDQDGQNAFQRRLKARTHSRYVEAVRTVKDVASVLSNIGGFTPKRKPVRSEGIPKAITASGS